MAYTLKIDHAAHYYSPVLHQFGLNTLVNRRLEASITFLRRLIVGLIDSPELLTQINFKIPSFNTRHIYHCQLVTPTIVQTTNHFTE